MILSRNVTPMKGFSDELAGMGYDLITIVPKGDDVYAVIGKGWDDRYAIFEGRREGSRFLTKAKALDLDGYGDAMFRVKDIDADDRERWFKELSDMREAHLRDMMEQGHRHYMEDNEASHDRFQYRANEMTYGQQPLKASANVRPMDPGLPGAIADYRRMSPGGDRRGREFEQVMEGSEVIASETDLCSEFLAQLGMEGTPKDPIREIRRKELMVRLRAQIASYVEFEKSERRRKRGRRARWSNSRRCRSATSATVSRWASEWPDWPSAPSDWLWP